MGLLLRATSTPPLLRGRGLARARIVRAGVAGRVALWIAAGALAWLGLACRSVRPRGRPRLVRGSAPRPPPSPRSYLRPFVTSWPSRRWPSAPSFPYAFTLPVALSQDWAPRPGRGGARGARWPCTCPPFVARAPPDRRLLRVVPGLRGPHPGLGAAVGGTSRQRAEVPAHGGGARPRADARRRGGRARHGGARAAAVPRGGARRRRERSSANRFAWPARWPAAAGSAATSIAATRITRQTIRGKEGGVFYVLAPGPLAPARARAARRPRAEPGPRRRGAAGRVRAPVERAGGGARGRRLPPRARCHGTPRAWPRLLAFGLRGHAALPFLWLPVLSRDAGGAR